MIQKLSTISTRLLLTAALLICFLTTFQTSFAQTDLRANFLFVAEKNQEQILASIQPGEKKDYSIVIQNTSGEQTINLKLYATDAITNNNGSISYKLAQDPQYHLGEWTSFFSDEITLKPLEKRTVNFSLAIPSYASPGNYAGAIMCELQNSYAGKNGEMKINIRKSFPILLEVPGETVTKYDRPEINYDRINNQFKISLANKGNTFLTAAGKITIRNYAGEIIDTIKLDQETILQQNFYQKSIFWNKKPIIDSINAKLELEINKFNVATNQSIKLEKFEQTTEFILFPWLETLILLAAILLFALTIIVSLKARKKYLAKLPVHYVNEGESILQIANLHQTNWRAIARLNHLKKPYSLHPGQLLKLPKPRVKNE